jgi:glucan phosphorylase
MSMDKPRFARQSGSAKTNHTDGGDLLTHPTTAPAADDDLDEIKGAVLAKLALDLGKDASVATDRDWFVAAALTIRDRVVHRWLTVDRTSQAQRRKRVYYLSLEFLIGAADEPSADGGTRGMRHGEAELRLQVAASEGEPY